MKQKLFTKSAFKVAFTCPRQLQLGDDKATSALEQALLRYCPSTLSPWSESGRNCHHYSN